MPDLPAVARRAFRFHMAYSVLEAVSLGILNNAPLMAVKTMGATDVQLQMPQIMTALGLFSAVFTGVAMATRSKKPFVVVPGVISAICALVMAWVGSAGWFLFASGMVSIFHFAIRPAMPSILRIVYPEHCRSHIAGTLRQYASVILLASSLLFAWLLSAAGDRVRPMIEFQLTLAGIASLAAFACFRQLPDRGDGSLEEATLVSARPGEMLAPLRDGRFRIFLAIFFLYCCGDLFYTAIIPAFFARDLGFGYVGATLMISIVPAVTAFVGGGYLTAWFDRTTIWRSYAMVTLLWGLDPVLLAVAAPFAWPVLAAARMVHGPATVGSMVLNVDTGIHRFTRPGPDTSRYMSLLFFVNGCARLLAPSAAAVLAGQLSHRLILLYGGMAILTASGLFLAAGEKDLHGLRAYPSPKTELTT